MNTAKPAYLNVLIVEEFETSAGKTARSWTKVGVAFPHGDGDGFNVELKAFPRDGKLVVLPPQSDERSDKAGTVSGAVVEATRATSPPSAKERAR
jgi:hypothetical protein